MAVRWNRSQLWVTRLRPATQELQRTDQSEGTQKSQKCLHFDLTTSPFCMYCSHLNPNTQYSRKVKPLNLNPTQSVSHTYSFCAALCIGWSQTDAGVQAGVSQGLLGSMDCNGQIGCTNMDGINLLCNDSGNLGGWHGPKHQFQPIPLLFFLKWLSHYIIFKIQRKC
ncbi:hypothetical protein XENOCAPTIV_001899 [Xenoophorus captivus]|uniref:Uncharacterized protein n=1 Tax=Xenoophorus captivus TaxID=1517983 RepID=A0ABV0RN94_9TELE